MTSDGRYSEVTEETYCTYDCLDDAESTYKRENWYSLINGKTGITLTMMKNTMRMKKISLISMSGIAVLVNMKEKPYQRYLLMNFGKKENFIVLETICLT